MYKEQLQTDKKTQIPHRKIGKINWQNKQLKQGSIQMVDKILKTCSSSLTGRGMKLKLKMRYYFILVGLSEIKKNLSTVKSTFMYGW